MQHSDMHDDHSQGLLAAIQQKQGSECGRMQQIVSSLLMLLRAAVNKLEKGLSFTQRQNIH